MEIPITLITSGILGTLFFVHSLRTIKGWVTTKTNLGDGGNELMVRRIWIHGNFSEYGSLLLLLLLFLEIKAVDQVLLTIHASAIILG